MEVSRGEDGRPGREAGAVVAGRYRLIARIGRGAFGEVWDAEDLLFGERVALKRLHEAGPEPAQARREIATLRLLRFPGVVRLLDEGDDEGHPFFVTERVLGAPFPGSGARATRPDLAGAASSTTADGGAFATNRTASVSERTRGRNDRRRVAPGTVRTDSTVSLPPSVMSSLHAGAGASAPSEQRGLAWSSIAQVTEALLRTLDRVHAAGIVHRDLKPANVLVRPDGQPVVLDFGLCLPAAEGSRPPGDNAIEGTPAYLSPEQIHGGPIDARADLYAVGVMIYEALTGHLPHDAPTLGALFALRSSQRAVPMHARDPSIPPAVATTVDELLAMSPADRPRSAADVLSRLRGSGGAERTRAWSMPEGDGPLDEAALRGLFSGRERLFHLRTDAAAALYQQTRGDRARVQAEVERWLDAGIARCDGDRLVVDRDALDRWAAGLPIVPDRVVEPAAASGDLPDLAWRATAAALAPAAPGRLVALVASGQDAAAASDALLRARALAKEGRLGLAAAELEEGLSAVRRCSEPSASAAEEGVLAEWVKVAFAEHRPRALDRVLYEVCRARSRGSPFVARLEGLLRAAIAARTLLSAEPATVAEDLGPFEDPALDRWRRWVSVRTRLMASPLTAKAALAEARAWADEAADTEAHAAVAGLQGSTCYVQGQFAEAADWHRQAARGEQWVTLRIGQMLNEAAALLEAFEPVRARETAERAAAVAAARRHAYLQGRAEVTARTAGYRAAAPLAPDFELVEALAEVDAPEILAVAYLDEAAIAFRCHDRKMAHELAGRAADTFHRCGRTYPAMLMEALAGAMGEGLSRDEAQKLATAAMSCAVPGIGIQTLGLLKWACPALPAPPPDVLATLCAQIPEEHWGDRMDVLSVDESRRALEGARSPTLVD